MQLKLDKRFWVVITCIIVVFTIFIVGRNLLHAIEIRKDIAILGKSFDQSLDSTFRRNHQKIKPADYSVGFIFS